MCSVLRKYIVFFLLTALFMAEVFADVPNVYMEADNFEFPEGYSVFPGPNNRQKFLQVNGETKWKIINETKAVSVSGYPDGFVETANGNTFFSTGTLQNKNKDQYLYNFSNKFTDTTVTYECRLRRPANGITMIALADRQMEEYYSKDAAKWLAEIYLYASNGNLSYRGEYTGLSSKVNETVAAYKTPNIGDWVYLRCVINLPRKTMKLYAGASLDTLQPWVTASPEKEFNFRAYGSPGEYTMAESSLGAMFSFNNWSAQAAQFAIDDLSVYYGTEDRPVANGLTIEGDAIVGHSLTGKYLYSDPFGNVENGSEAIWRRSDDAEFTSNVVEVKRETVVENGISVYIPTDADVGKYLQFAVVPKSIAEINHTGAEASKTLEDVVRVPVTVPATKLVLPHPNIRVREGEPVYLSAEASADDTTVTRVDYYADDRIIASAGEAPFTVRWENPEQGEYTVYAKATNALGETGDSETIQVTVIPQPEIADEFDFLREKWRKMMTGGTDYDPTLAYVKTYLSNLDMEAEKNLAYFAGTPSYSRSDLSKVENLSTAYATAGSRFQGRTDVRDAILNAFTQINAQASGYNTESAGEFWGMEFGYPTSICNIISMTYEELPAALIESYMAAIDKQFRGYNKYTAANKVWQCQAVMLRGVMGKDDSWLTGARDAMVTVCQYVTSGEGLYEDGSMIQHHGISYNGGYGKSLFREYTQMVSLLYGSDYEVTAPLNEQMYQIAFDAYADYIYRGEFMDMTRGREIASPLKRNSHRIGHQAIHGFIRLTEYAPEPYRTEYKRLIKKWIIEDTYFPFFETDLPLDILNIADKIMQDDSIRPAEENIGHVRGSCMARVVHTRPGWAAGLSMTSKRAANYEALAGNGYGFYTGAGMLYLYNDDVAQFADHFWSTINWYRLPGTTVDTVPRSHSTGASSYNPYDWVGGSDVEGKYGASGMYLGQWNTTLQAKKSWFMLDDEIVALGAGITSTDSENSTIETIVENRKIRDDGQNVFLVDGVAQPVHPGWTDVAEAPKWIHLEGNVESSDIGYFFPEEQQVYLLRESRPGVNAGLYELSGYDLETPKKYVTMWFDHGSNPAEAEYSYALLPDKSVEETDAYAKDPDFEILSNTKDMQAIYEKKLDLVAANFWNDGISSVGGITVDKKASVTMKKTGDILEIGISDPTMNNTGMINLEIDQSALEVVSLSDGMQMMAVAPKIKLQVNVSKALGKTFTAKFRMAAKNPVVINAFYHIPTDTLVDFMITDDVNDPYVPPAVENPSEYVIKQFVWEDMDSIRPLEPAKIIEQLN